MPLHVRRGCRLSAYFSIEYLLRAPALYIFFVIQQLFVRHGYEFVFALLKCSPASSSPSAARCCNELARAAKRRFLNDILYGSFELERIWWKREMNPAVSLVTGVSAMRQWLLQRLLNHDRSHW